MIYLKSVRDIANGVSSATARFAWIHGYHAAQKIAMPVILTAILVTEKVDQEIDHLKSDLNF